MSSKKKRKKKKGGSLLLRGILILIVFAVIGVAVWQLPRFFSGKATTAIVTESSIGNYYSGKLVIARKESLYETENKTRIDFVAEEGSKVSRKGTICKVYSSGYNQTEIGRLQGYRDEIQAYHINQVFDTYVDAELDSENEKITTLSEQVKTLIQGHTTGSLPNLEKQLTTALTVRKNYLRQKYPDDQTLSELYKVENDQLKKIESWTTTHTATEDCIVSFYTDGYETTVNNRTYGTLTPSDVRAVIRGEMPEQSTVSRGSDPIFRTVIEDEWYALFLCTDRDWNPVVNETYKLSLAGFSDYVPEAVVQSFTRIGGDLLVRMKVSSSVEPVLNIRTCDATVGNFVSGLHVPMNALYGMDNMLGVVVVEGGMQTFVEVVVISYPDENTAFIRPRLNGSPLTAGKSVMLF